MKKRRNFTTYRHWQAWEDDIIVNYVVKWSENLLHAFEQAAHRINNDPKRTASRTVYSITTRYYKDLRGKSEKLFLLLSAAGLISNTKNWRRDFHPEGLPKTTVQPKMKKFPSFGLVIVKYK